MKIGDLKAVLEKHRLWLTGEGGERADLQGADLRGAIGNGKEIRSLDVGIYSVCITKHTLYVGCKQIPFKVALKVKYKDFKDDISAKDFKYLQSVIRPIIKQMEVLA